MKTKKAVLFDMDGLMLDTERVAVLAFDYAGEMTGIGKAGYIVSRILGLTVPEARGTWRAEFGDGYREDELMKYKNLFLDEYYKKNPVPKKPGLDELLRYLKAEGYLLSVASSTVKERVYSLLTAVGVIGYFDSVVCGDMITRSKPAPDIYLKSCETLGVLPADSIALEDGKSGIKSAYAAGCDVIMIPDLLMPDAETDSMTFATVGDLFAAVECIKNNFVCVK